MIKLAVLGTIFFIGLYTIVGTVCKSRNEFVSGIRTFTGLTQTCNELIKR